MAGMGLAWLLGVALQLQERTLLPLWAYLSCLALGLVCCAVAWRWPRLWALPLVAALAMGVGASGWRASERLSEALPSSLEGQDVQVIGVVAILPHQSPLVLRFRFEVEESLWQGRVV